MIWSYPYKFSVLLVEAQMVVHLQSLGARPYSIDIGDTRKEWTGDLSESRSESSP